MKMHHQDPIFFTRYSLLCMSILGLLLASCSSDDPIPCDSEEGRPVDGFVLLADEDGQAIAVLGDSILTLCSQEAIDSLEALDDTYAFTGRYFDCNECLEIQTLTGPGCLLETSESPNDLPLVGTTWHLASITTSQRTYLPPCNQVPTLLIDAEGLLMLQVGNSLSNRVEVEEGQIAVLSEMASTQMLPRPYVFEVEQLLASAIDNGTTLTYEIEKNRLAITTEAGMTMEWIVPQ